MRKFKEGDHVLVLLLPKGIKKQGIIYYLYPYLPNSNYVYQIKDIDGFSIDSSEKHIELDYSYYREQKLKEILDE